MNDGFYSTLCILLSQCIAYVTFSNISRKGEISAIGLCFCGVQLQLYDFIVMCMTHTVR
jgi:hypothetical protein